jgi:Uncharacterized vancomycin resistance protein
MPERQASTADPATGERNTPGSDAPTVATPQGEPSAPADPSAKSPAAPDGPAPRPAATDGSGTATAADPQPTAPTPATAAQPAAAAGAPAPEQDTVPTAKPGAPAEQSAAEPAADDEAGAKTGEEPAAIDEATVAQPIPATIDRAIDEGTDEATDEGTDKGTDKATTEAAAATSATDTAKQAESPADEATAEVVAPIPTAPAPTAPAPTAPAPAKPAGEPPAKSVDQPAATTTAQPAAAQPTTQPTDRPATPPNGKRPAPPAGDEQTVVLARPTSAWFEPWADEPTQALPVNPAAKTTGAVDEDPTRPSKLPPLAQPPISNAEANLDPVTERLPLPPRGEEPPADEPPTVSTADGGATDRPPRRRGRKLLLGIGALVVLAGLVYGGDLLLSQGTIPRGVTVAGVPIGGMEPTAAEQRLRAELEPRATAPVPVQAGEAASTIDPVAAGLRINWPATIAAAGEQPLNPITRITSLFTSRPVDVVSDVDEAALDAALTELSPIVNRPAAEGTVRFEGTRPIAVDPEPGQELDVAAAAQTLRREWVNGATVVLPLTTLPPLTTAEGVAKAIETVAEPAIASPFTLTGEAGTAITLTPQQIASVLTFKPGENGDLIGEVNPTMLEQVAGEAFAPSERPGRDASIDVSSGTPVIVPSQDGRGVDWEATAVAMGPPLISADQRRIEAVYADKPADLTTEEIKELGITSLVSEFTTGGFATDSGRNIKRAAEQINGTVVRPGETFSLNAKTNPRDASNGYVEAGIIEDGHPSRGVGGGVSQVATTLYNAAYFAGLTLLEHKEHSYYISRYPAGREATVFGNVIDLKFRNDTPTAIMIQTAWTPTSITVRMFGTKYYEVTSITGPRTAPTAPKTVTIPAGQPCSPSKGAPGFTVTDTRVLKNIRTGEVRTEPTRTVRYNPSPIVECGG